MNYCPRCHAAISSDLGVAHYGRLYHRACVPEMEEPAYPQIDAALGKAFANGFAYGVLFSCILAAVAWGAIYYLTR